MTVAPPSLRAEPSLPGPARIDGIRAMSHNIIYTYFYVLWKAGNLA